MSNKESIHRFIETIDCNFPYENARIGEYLIFHACNDLNNDAVFAIFYEIIYPGKSHKVDLKSKLYYLSLIDKYWNNPNKEFFVSIAKRKITEDNYSEEEIVNILKNMNIKNNLSSIFFIELLYNDYSKIIELEAEKIRATLFK